MGEVSNLHLHKVLEMARAILKLSEEGFACCEDDGCLMLNGLLRECSFKIQNDAKRELHVHRDLENTESALAENDTRKMIPGPEPPVNKSQNRGKGGLL